MGDGQTFAARGHLPAPYLKPRRKRGGGDRGDRFCTDHRPRQYTLVMVVRATQFDSYIFTPKLADRGRVKGAACTDAIRSETALAVEPGPFGAARVGDGAFVGLADEPGVFREEPGLVARRGGAPSGAALGQYWSFDEEVHASA